MHDKKLSDLTIVELIQMMLERETNQCDVELINGGKFVGTLCTKEDVVVSCTKDEYEQIRSKLDEQV